MAVVRILSGGAAQAVVEKIAAKYKLETGGEVEAEFSAVGAMKKRVLADDPADVIILTAALIDELVASGHVRSGSRRDLGSVGTGVAARADMPLPDVSTPRALRANLLSASDVVCPDPEVATAGRVVRSMLEQLGITAQMQSKLRYFPNGYAAMNWLANSEGPLQLGITQITEIRANPGVTYAGPLPGNLQVKTTYSAGLAARAQHPGEAREFIARLTSAPARPILAEAGYEFDAL